MIKSMRIKAAAKITLNVTFARRTSCMKQQI
jgi:hypothetical protein